MLAICLPYTRARAGLLAASCAAGPSVQASMVRWLFTPLHEQWVSPEWLARLSSPTAFVNAYMALELEQAPAGSGSGSQAAGAAGGQQVVVVGCRYVRWRCGGAGRGVLCLPACLLASLPGNVFYLAGMFNTMYWDLRCRCSLSGRPGCCANKFFCCV